MIRIVLSFLFISLLVSCVSTSVKTSISSEPTVAEEECFNKVVGLRTYGKEVPSEDLLAHSGGVWKVRQVRVFQKVSKGNSVPTYFAFAVEPKITANDIGISNTKTTLLCESNPNNAPLNVNTMTFVTSFDATLGDFSEAASVQVSLDGFSIFNGSAWFTEKKGRFLMMMDQMNTDVMTTKIFRLSSKEADIRSNVETALDGYQIEMSSSVSYELRTLP